MFVTCGDSYACIDKRESKELQWPIYVANNLGYTSSQQLHLGRGARDNWYIFLQAKWALENYNIDRLIAWWTSVYRFFVKHPDTVEEDNSSLVVNEVGTHINRHETNYVYDNYTPQYISETYNNVISDGIHAPGSRKRHNMVDEDWEVLQKYWEKFHSVKKGHLELQTMQYVIEHLCEKKGVEYFNFPDRYLARSMMKAEEFDPDSLILANHYGVNGHKVIGDYIWKTIERKSNTKRNS